MLATKPNFKNQLDNSLDNSLAHKIYWLNQLSGELSVAKIAPDFLETQDFKAKNNIFQFELPIILSEKIIGFTCNSNLSIYAVLLSCFKILLHKYTDEQEIIIGCPSYHHPGLIEPSKNQILPLRSSVDSNLTFKSFLLEIKNTLIEAYLNQDYSLEKLTDLLDLPVDSNDQSSLFDIIFFLENIHSQKEVTKINNSLTLACLVEKNKIKVKIEYSDLLFQAQTIELISQAYLTIIEQVINNIQLKIADITLLNILEQEQLLVKSTENTQDYPVTKTIPELFTEQVKQTPDKIAAIDNQTCLTYQELNIRANQLARLLHQLEVKPGEFIGVLKERDFDFLIAILAILKVGGIYLPIDNTYPTARIEYMLSNSQVRFLLTDSSDFKIVLNSKQSNTSLKYLIYLDEKPETTAIQSNELTIYDAQSFQELPTDNLEINQTGIDPAYMIYTSGSTGVPKGVIIRHGSAINHIYGQFEALNLTQDLIFLQSAPTSSDISVWQFLAPILIGGKTVIINAETVCNPEQLFQLIQQAKITLVELVPGVLRGLLDYLRGLSTEARTLPCLQWMMITGESVSVDLVNSWLQLYPAIPVVNAYGPSEAADDITQEIIRQPLPANQRSVPIGQPLGNLNVYILNRKMQLLPIGVPGEICVSGYGVGMGYWQNEAKTQASFVPNPFPQNAKPLPGIKADLLYKTGDLGRWLTNGSIEYLGRIDHQVKIRGFRIELAEIETILRQHPGIRESVVTVREENPDDKYIVAYLISRNPDETELEKKLRNFLKEKLPQYMIPSAFVWLDKLPLTPSGKVDRRALPEADRTNGDRACEFTPPRTANEKIVADIWCRILKREQISIHDNFFDLGGHSLVATQVISQLREAFKIELPLRSLFEELTVAGMVEYIEKIQTVQKLQTFDPIQVTGDREEIEL